MSELRPIERPRRASEDSFALGRELYRLEQLGVEYRLYVQHHAFWVGGEPDSYEDWVDKLRYPRWTGAQVQEL